MKKEEKMKIIKKIRRIMIKQGVIIY